MKLLNGDDAFQILPQADGFIFATQQVTYENKVLISYKNYSFDTSTVTPVTRNVYLLNKFGNNFKLYEEELKNFLACKVAQLPKYRSLVVLDNGDSFIYSSKFNLLWSGHITYKGEGPADMLVSDTHLWFSFAKSNVVARYGISTLREELRVGGGNTPAFSLPHGIRLENDNLYICNKGSNKIREININNYIIQDYAKFDEPVYFYYKIKSREIALLKSGIYQL